MANSGQLALIHVAKNELRMSDADYRKLLSNYDGATSSKQLNTQEVDDLLITFKAMGFVAKTKRPAPPSAYSREGYATRRQVWYIKKLWQTSPVVRNKTLEGLDSYLKRIVGVDHVEWIKMVQVQKIIKAIQSLGRGKRK